MTRTSRRAELDARLAALDKRHADAMESFAIIDKSFAIAERLNQIAPPLYWDRISDERQSVCLAAVEAALFPEATAIAA